MFLKITGSNHLTYTPHDCPFPRLRLTVITERTFNSAGCHLNIRGLASIGRQDCLQFIVFRLQLLNHFFFYLVCLVGMGFADVCFLGGSAPSALWFQVAGATHHFPPPAPESVKTGPKGALPGALRHSSGLAPSSLSECRSLKMFFFPEFEPFFLFFLIVLKSLLSEIKIKSQNTVS